VPSQHLPSGRRLLSLGMDKLPVNETLGVFFGVAGFDWLTDGQADPLAALLAALAAGAVILTLRHLRPKTGRD